MRRFAVLFGATAPAMATTLAAVFLGLAAGSAAFGSISRRLTRPVRAFGLLEIGVGLGALATEPLLRLHDHLPPGWQAALAGHQAAALGLKLALATVAVFVPTFCMGGSLPVLAQAVRLGATHLGARAGALYAVNTCGAALGALLVPAALLPALGASRGLVALVAGSILVGLAATFADRAWRMTSPAEEAPAPTRRVAKQEALPSISQRQLAGWALLSGALTLALESLWSRTLALVHESSLHSFAVVLAVFLLGLSLGAAAGAWLMARGAPPLRLLAVSWSAAGVAVLISPRLFMSLTDGMRYVAGLSWSAHEARLAGLALALMLPATICAGIAMPVLMEMAGAASQRDAGSLLGRLLAANLVGSMLGPIVVSFLVVPRVGLWWSLTIVGGALAVAGEAAHAARGQKGDLARVVTLGALGFFVLLLSPGSVPRVRLESGESVVSLREGALGTVAVVENGYDRRISIDNFYTVGGTLSTGDERLQGHLPLLLHAAPRRVAFLGLGTGISAGAALMHPVEGVEIAELLPQVVDAARDDFAEANIGITENPRVHVVVDDARTFLRASGPQFDVIVGDLFVPWRRGEASTYSLEQFEAARAALAPGGIFCQWVPLYQLDEADFRVVATTFLHAFPSATLWRGDFHAEEPALALVGFESTQPLAPAEIDARVRQLAEHPDPTNPYLADPAGLWLYLVGVLDPADEWLTSAALNRDDAPWIELRSARRQPDGTAGFVGEELTPLLERLRQQPLDGPLARLDPQHVAWRDAGADLWRASLLGAAGREQDADTLGMATLATLPEPLQLAVSEAMRGSP